MNIQNSAKLLRQQNEYLASLKIEDITFIIKSCIYELENQKQFSNEDLIELNKVIQAMSHLIIYILNTIKILNTKGVIFLEEINDLAFIVSFFIILKLEYH